MCSVSVIIPTYNGGKYILDAVNSVLQQTHAPMEIIVVDDGSQEDILPVLSPVLHKISYIRQDHAGPGAARNKGIRAARGEFIAFIDDDDLWHPTKLEMQMRMFDQDPECGMVYSFPIFMDESGSPIPTHLPHCPSGYIYYDLVRYNRVHTTSAVIVRTSVFDKVGLFDESITVCEDYDLWLRIAKNYKLLFSSEGSVYYRQSPSGVSKQVYKHLRGHLYVINKVIEQFINGEVKGDETFLDALDENLHEVYRRFIYKVYYENDDRFIARHLLIGALEKDPWNLKDIVYLILFSLPETWFEYARNLKRAIFGSKTQSSRGVGCQVHVQ